MRIEEVRKSIMELKDNGWDSETLDAFKERFLRDRSFLDSAVREILRPWQGDKFVDEWIVIHHDVRYGRGKISGRIRLGVKSKKELEPLRRDSKWIIIASWNTSNDLLLDAIWGFEMDAGALQTLNRAIKNKKKNLEVLFNEYEILFKQRKIVLFYRTQINEDHYNKKIWDWLINLKI